MIIDLKRSIDLRWLFDPVLLFIILRWSCSFRDLYDLILECCNVREEERPSFRLIPKWFEFQRSIYTVLINMGKAEQTSSRHIIYACPLSGRFTCSSKERTWATPQYEFIMRTCLNPRTRGLFPHFHRATLFQSDERGATSQAVKHWRTKRIKKLNSKKKFEALKSLNNKKLKQCMVMLHIFLVNQVNLTRSQFDQKFWSCKKAQPT